MVENAQTLKYSDPDAYYNILFETGAICHERSETKTSNKAFAELLEFLKNAPVQDPVKINTVKVRLGASLARSPSTIVPSTQLLEEVDESQLPEEELIRLFRVMAYNYMTLNQLEKAKEYYDRFPEGVDDSSDVYRAEFYTDRFALHGDPLDYQNAKDLYARLIQHCEATKPGIAVSCLCNLGLMQVAEEKFDEGIASVKESIRLADATLHGHDITLYTNRGLLVEALIDSKRFAEAREVSKDLLERAKAAPESALVKRFESLLRIRICTCELADKELTFDTVRACIDTLTKLEDMPMLPFLDYERWIDLAIAHEFLKEHDQRHECLELAGAKRLEILQKNPKDRSDLNRRNKRLLNVATELSLENSAIGEFLKAQE